jgi:hypothetical protein
MRKSPPGTGSPVAIRTPPPRTNNPACANRCVALEAAFDGSRTAIRLPGRRPWPGRLP